MQRTRFLLAFILSLTISFTMKAGLFTVPTTSAAQAANQVLSTPTLSVSGQTTPETATHGTPPLGLTLFLLGFCCIFLLLIGVFVLGLVVRRQNQKNVSK